MADTKIPIYFVLFYNLLVATIHTWQDFKVSVRDLVKGNGSRFLEKVLDKGSGSTLHVLSPLL